ncbi:MAG: phage portal protein [Inquilinus sp.]|uniref:phage portal protein n=1 Tax=Inquilinus sp. TaxID=1932117 RepID=UPI003F2E35F1
MNVLDRTIAWLSPEAGAKRARARAVIEAVRGYEGAKGGRRTDGWYTPSTSANAEVGPAMTRLRNRARDLVRNSPYAARIVDVLTANIVGSGIVPRSKTGDKDLDRKVNDIWSRWVDQADADGQLDYYGLQALMVRGMIESGEQLMRFRPRRASDGLVVPLQVQVLEPDFIDDGRSLAAIAGKPTIRQGIEFDPLGRRVAYYMWRDHPGDAFADIGFQRESTRIPASEVLHLYRKQRAGQIRGASWLSPVILKIRDLEDYHDAALMKAKIEACFAGFVTQLEDGKTGPLGTVTTGPDGKRVEHFEPGMVAYLQPGQGIEFADPSQQASNFDPFTMYALMAIMVGAGVTYDQGTGDLRQANYSSLRAGKVEQRRQVEQIQWHTAIPIIGAPVWYRVMREAVGMGELPERDYPADWMPPRSEPVDPAKDLAADVAEVRAGGMTPQQFIAKRGYDPTQQAEEIAEWNKLIDALGVILDSDPRKVSRAGLTQARPAGSEIPDA